MATARQIAANRRNAKRSTGPRTDEGKERSKYNAFKHGLAANTLLPHENPLEYHQMRASLIETWQPANAQELLEVDNITMGWWCMQRSNRFERRMFELQLQHMKTIHKAATRDPHPDDDGGIAASFCNRDNDKSYEVLFRYDARAASKYYRALDHLMKLQSFRTRRQRTQPADFNPESASFGGAHPAIDARPDSAPPCIPEPVGTAAPSSQTPQPDSLRPERQALTVAPGKTHTPPRTWDNELRVLGSGGRESSRGNALLRPGE